MLKLRTFDSAGRLISEVEVANPDAASETARADEMCVAYEVAPPDGLKIADWVWIYDEDSETGTWNELIRLGVLMMGDDK
jgi:hypothetical protein